MLLCWTVGGGQGQSLALPQSKADGCSTEQTLRLCAVVLAMSCHLPEYQFPQLSDGVVTLVSCWVPGDEMREEWGWFCPLFERGKWGKWVFNGDLSAL